MEKKKFEPKLTVHRTIKRLKTVLEDVETEEPLEILTYESEVGRVGITKGVTLNLGDFRSVRADVHLTLPCYPEEVDEVFEAVDEIVDSRLVQEVESILEKFK
jgi:hypothetical protein